MRTYDPLLKCVAYLGVRPQPGGDPTFGGTAFFLMHRDNRVTRDILFIATAAHCAREIQASGKNCVLRVGAEICDLGLVDWIYHPDRSVDVAVIIAAKNVGEKIPLEEIIPVDARALLTDAKQQSKNIGLGDQVGIVGMYALRPGKTKNMPIVHTGHIAMMPDDSEPLEIADPVRPGGTLTHSPYLIEAQGLRGLSGAPVFVRRSLALPLKGAPNDEFMAYGSLWLLGLWHGAWQRPPDSILAEDRGLSHLQRVPVGVGLAIPAVRIIEAMEHAVTTLPAGTGLYGQDRIDSIAGSASARSSSGSSLPFLATNLSPSHTVGVTGSILRADTSPLGHSSIKEAAPDVVRQKPKTSD